MQVTSATSGAQSGADQAATGWTSRFAFLMASVGFAVGLGNIWRFPYVTGENGGGAFVLVYLACAFAIGVPILMGELLVGRRGKMSPPLTMRKVAEQENRSTNWQFVGHMNVLAAFVIMLVYCVISGWVLNYLFKAVMTGFAGVDGAAAAMEFESMLGSAGTMLFWDILGLTITGTIIYAGVQDGIERAVTVLMPGLFALLIALVIYNIFVGGFGDAISYLFTPDFSKIGPSTLLAAIGQAFFSVGVAMAGMMTYGAYLPKSVSIPRSVGIIVIADTMVALMAGLVIFPAVFNNGLDPAGGPGLIFQTLPVAFAGMPGGHIVSILFFLLLSVAAITSMVGLIEPQTRWLEEHKGYARHKSALVIIGVIALLSILSILGYNSLAEFKIGGKDINGVMDFFSNQILLPVGGLLIAIFVGWFVSRKTSMEELDIGDGLVFKAWYFLIRFVVPVAVLLVFVLGVSE